MKRKIFEISEEAENFIVENLNRLNKPYLLIRITKKGCGGKSYEFVPIDKKPDSCENQPLKQNKEIVVEYKDLLFLIGSNIILKNNLLEKKIDIVNNLEKSRCGCGQSFIA